VNAASTSPLELAAARYGKTATDLTPLGAFESDVYAFAADGGEAILKVISPSHRTPAAVQAEVDWLLALVAEGVPVAAPLPSSAGRHVELVPGADGPTVLVAFRRAPGALSRPGDWTPLRLESWGALLGRLQAHSRGWRPPGPCRGTLLEQTYLARAAEICGADEELAAAATALLERARPWLDGSGDAGLVHADLHHGNVLLHGEEWTAIDFDDCAYGSYAFDLAMPLYYAVRAEAAREADAVAAEFLPPLLTGLRRHAPLPAGGAEALAVCLEARQAELYLAIKHKLPPERWNESTRRVVDDLRRRVLAGGPVVSLDTLAACLTG